MPQQNRTNKKQKFSLLVLTIVTSLSSFAQQIEPAKQRVPSVKNYKNVIRYNLASAILFNFNKAIIFGYERVVSPHQSFSINIGSTGLPLGNGFRSDSISHSGTKNKKGLNFSADYRFYLAKENKHPIPRGIYIGPYYSYNQFDRSDNWSYLQSSGSPLTVSTNANLTINTIGAELGYQFILWKRLALDLVVVGPGYGGYSLKTSTQGNLTPAQKEKLQDALIAAIGEKLPGLSDILDNEPLNSRGSFKTSSFGYRYLVHIGFLF